MRTIYDLVPPRLRARHRPASTVPHDGRPDPIADSPHLREALVRPQIY